MYFSLVTLFIHFICTKKMDIFEFKMQIQNLYLCLLILPYTVYFAQY